MVYTWKAESRGDRVMHKGQLTQGPDAVYVHMLHLDIDKYVAWL